ncbi:hypothetical protein Q31b_19310 [Novipirellula aureliae]|uniref:Uncharacterized protein n=1 Tax=Novipirellula aureliae TaxID=2527966 RepID=A0A5C6E764_9BACT|nr:hypothetical protein Q31b_19310 [Novipirellula aureliae]
MFGDTSGSFEWLGFLAILQESPSLRAFVLQLFIQLDGVDDRVFFGRHEI